MKVYRLGFRDGSASHAHSRFPPDFSGHQQESLIAELLPVASSKAIRPSPSKHHTAKASQVDLLLFFQCVKPLECGVREFWMHIWLHTHTHTCLCAANSKSLRCWDSTLTYGSRLYCARLQIFCLGHLVNDSHARCASEVIIHWLVVRVLG